MNTSMPVCQIGFTTAVPGTSENDGLVRASPNSKIHDLVESLNKQFLRKPLPGMLTSRKNGTYVIWMSQAGNL